MSADRTPSYRGGLGFGSVPFS